jgi:IS30 family transposase
MRNVRGLDAAGTRELWARWKRGEGVVEIARSLGEKMQRVRGWIHQAGGIAPAERTRGEGRLKAHEREEISRGLSEGLAFAEIARGLGRHTSTVSREVGRNGGAAEYRAVEAEANAWDKQRRPKTCLLAKNAPLCTQVAEKLALFWSPQQIAGWLKREHGEASTMRISHETIYQSLFVQARGVLKRELLGALRKGKLVRRPHGAATKTMKRSLIPDAISISERPPEAEDRAVPGHWEGDLLMGGTGTRMATLVERRSRFVMLVKIGAKSADHVAEALVRQVCELPTHLKASLTWDRGSEMSEHATFTMATDVKVYFCDPHSPWQRGSNENTNGLLRQYFPKGCDLARFTQADLDKVAAELNGRPRKTLGYRPPAEVYAESVALTG